MVGEEGEEMKLNHFWGEVGSAVWEDMDGVGQDVRAPDIGRGERKMDVQQALTIGRKGRIIQ